MFLLLDVSGIPSDFTVAAVPTTLLASMLLLLALPLLVFLLL
jgi:NhaP-type Na+/H+ and K+/H+ antiporter